MITVKFFASLRESLGKEEEVLDFQANLDSVAAIREALVLKHGSSWQEVLIDNSVLMAVNQVMSDPEAVVSDGDEVAFFPPVTGG